MRSSAAALALLAAACVQPPGLAHEPYSSSPTTVTNGGAGGDASWSSAREASAARELLVDGRVAVRLAALEGHPTALVRGAAGLPAGGARRVEASALDRGERLRLAPPRGGRLELDGRAFAGELVFELRPTGGLRVHELIDPDLYVRGVVAAELAIWSAPPALLEAQAIAARTYAAYTLRARGGTAEGAYLWDTTFDQAYATADRIDALPSNVRRRLDTAVEHTAGLVLVRRGVLVEALYHASCGGWTASVLDVFGRRGPLVPVPCPPCERLVAERDPDVVWTWTASSSRLSAVAQRLGLGTRLVTLGPTLVDDHGRWLQARLSGSTGSTTLSLNELRRELGATQLKGSRIERTWPAPGSALSSGLRFEGRGRGHGVGLCQTGARGLAEAGASAGQILSHYYSGATPLPWQRVPGMEGFAQ